jgi:hypothetical protein
MSGELPAERFHDFDKLRHSHFQLMRKQKSSR